MQAILDWLTHLAETTNVTWFSAVGSFLEEIIAPIPSPFVLTTSGALADAHDFTWLQIAGLLIIVSLAKTLASWIIYVFADKSEDFFFAKFGRFLPITHKQIEHIGAYLSGTKWDDFLLLLARSAPFVPSVAISVAAGAIKYNMRSYLIMTFLGSIVRSAFYFWIGYIGTEQATRLISEIKGSPAAIVAVVLLGIVVIIALARVKDAIWDKILDNKKPSIE